MLITIFIVPERLISRRFLISVLPHSRVGSTYTARADSGQAVDKVSLSTYQVQDGSRLIQRRVVPLFNLIRTSIANLFTILFSQKFSTRAVLSSLQSPQKMSESRVFRSRATSVLSAETRDLDTAYCETISFESCSF